jgi:hypothetical protein
MPLENSKCLSDILGCPKEEEREEKGYIVITRACSCSTTLFSNVFILCSNVQAFMTCSYCAQRYMIQCAKSKEKS